MFSQRAVSRFEGLFTADPAEADRFGHEIGSAGRLVVRRQTPAGEWVVSVSGNEQLPVHLAERPSGLVAVVDGEFYGPAAPATNSAEYVLDRYEAGGIAALAKMTGAASVMLWDPEFGLRLFRDPDGAAPLFAARTDSGLYWSSDIAPLVGRLPERRINLTALDFFLSEGYVPAPWTLVEGIDRLTAGEMLSATAPHTLDITDYAYLTGQPKLRLSNVEQARRYGVAFTHAMERRYESTRSNAVLLSGGVDSTLMTAVLAKTLGASVRTFTFQYSDYQGVKNEGVEARQAAEYFGVPHELIPMSARDVIERAPRMLAEYEEPFSFALHSFKLDALAEAGIEVVFSGQGSGQYQLRREALQYRYAGLPAPLRRAARLVPPLIGLGSPRFAQKLRGIMVDNPASADRAYSEELTPAALRAGLYQAADLDGHRAQALSLYQRMLDRHATEAPRDQMIFLSERMKADHMALWNHRWSRAHGLVMRQPYRDPELLDVLFHAQNPEHGKLAQRRFAETLMPHEIAHAPKLHQHVPIVEWLREGGPLVEYVREQLSPARVERSGLFNPTAVNELIESHAAGQDHAWTIWGLVLILLWQEAVLGDG